MMAANASDRVTLNVGGRLFETTKTTLRMSGAGYFHALFSTGVSLATGSNDDDDANNSNAVIFIDSDGSVFEDVLYFMRRSKLRSETKVKLSKLLDLKSEAEFFAYLDLTEACDFAITKLNATAMIAFQEPVRSFTTLGPLIVMPNDLPTRVDIGEGEVLYVVSATLSGQCQFKRYRPNPDLPKTNNKPSCYLDTCNADPPANSGDFQLLVNFAGRTESDRLCIAHVGLDNVHIEGHPVNFDLRQDLRLCLVPYKNRKFIEFEVRGAADWHILCYKGRPENIPGLESKSLIATTFTSMLENLKQASDGKCTTDTEESYHLMALSSLMSGSGGGI